MNAQSVAFYKNNPGKASTYARVYRKRNPNGWKNSQLKYHFGITINDYNELLRRQKGVCAICGETNKYMKRKRVNGLVVDHCHKKDRVRGLLCDACNLAVGLMKDDVRILRNAIKYLS